jgi:hypothetical protein
VCALHVADVDIKALQLDDEYAPLLLDDGAQHATLRELHSAIAVAQADVEHGHDFLQTLHVPSAAVNSNNLRSTFLLARQ